MITGLKIERLRGIREGELTGLAPLTILVGSNGSGKSALLDALLIACSSDPGDAVGRSVRRRISTSHGARWLVWKRGENGAARVQTSETTDGRLVEIELGGAGLERGGGALRVQAVTTLTDPAGIKRNDQTNVDVLFRTNNEYEARPRPERGSTGRFVRLIDPLPGANQAPLWSVYDRVLNAGHKQEARDLLADVIPDFEDVTMSAEEDATPALRLLYRSAATPEASRGVPIGLAGDGIYVLTRIAFELAMCRSGLALIEEPEVHQYPKTLWRIALAITAAVKRGVQVVLTTHSEELIRMLLEQANAGVALDRAVVIKVRLLAGRLISSSLPGHEAWVAAEQIGDDLR